jgi:MinD-like ATPase involved in chromosome partitioning or flagellar assembly
VARCASATDVLRVVQAASTEVALLDEDLHLLDDEQLGHFAAAGVSTIVIAREPDSERWAQWQSLTMLSAEADPSEVLQAIHEARAGRPSRGPRVLPRDPSLPGKSATEHAGHLQVLAFWSGSGSPGRTTLATNCGVLLGWVARTVIVDLDLTAAAVTAQLDKSRPSPGGRGWVASGLLQIASANPDSPDRWSHEIFRVARPLGAVSPQADVLAGVLLPRLREGISPSFVERLILELRRHYTYVLLDLGDEPLGEPSRESAICAAALRAADQIFVVCPADGPGLHQTYMALANAGSALDRSRAGLLVNRFDQRYHRAELEQIEAALELPIVGVLPVDFAAVQRALGEGRPVVSDPRSKLRRPLQELAERVHGGRVLVPTERPGRFGFRLPRRIGTAAASITGVAASSLSALGGGR